MTVENTTESPADGLKSRQIALVLLRDITAGHLPLDEAFAANQALATLTPRDRAFVRKLVATTLRRRGQVDALIRTYMRRPLPQRANAVRAILQLGVVQLLFLETPAHAVVDTSVRLCNRFPGQKGLVNAVLRRISEDGAEKLAARCPPRLNTPKWLWETWEKAYGARSCEAIAKAHIAEPPLDISVKSDPESWAERLGGAVLPGGTIRLQQAGDIAALAGFGEGGWWIQDVAASLPAQILLSALPEGGKGATVIDLCAAPGGKTAQLAAAGARVTALDRSGKRLRVLAENMARLKLGVQTVTADARKWQPAGPADAILLDAPCTATGTIRRHPDVLYNKRPEDILKMRALQTSLLGAAMTMLKPGGVLVYSVCSLQAEEGPEVIKQFLAEDRSSARLPIRPEETGMERKISCNGGDVRTLPFHLAEEGGMDGFFIARLTRNKDGQ